VNKRIKDKKKKKGEVPGIVDNSVRSIQHLFQKRMRLPSWCTAKETLFTAKMVKLEAGIL
jgi:hypothetical protein